MKPISVLTAFITWFALAGCGGGGSSTPAPATPAASSQVRTMQTQVVPPNYAVGSAQRAAYDYLSAQRQLCGFGLLQQSTTIDAAAQAHADYLMRNHLQRTHFEDSARFPDGFTGITVADRMVATGYDGLFAAEVIGGSNVTYGSSYGQASVMDLFTGPYHGYAMLLGAVDAGFGFAQAGSDPETNQLVINFGATAARPLQLLASNEIVSYPCNGTTGILSKSYAAEAPTPIAGRDIGAEPIGHPIYLKVRDGNALALQTYALRKAGSDSPLALQLLDQSNDSNSKFRDHSVAVLMPLLPLDRNTSYTFVAAGTNNGQPLQVAFSFSTGQY